MINISQDGQLAMRDVLRMYLTRIERDAAGAPVKLYLFTRARQADEPKVVVIDPYVSFGRPVLVGTGISTAVIADLCLTDEACLGQRWPKRLCRRYRLCGGLWHGIRPRLLPA